MSEKIPSIFWYTSDLESILTALLLARPDWLEPITAMCAAVGAAPPQHYIDAQLAGPATGDQVITVRRQLRTLGRG